MTTTAREKELDKEWVELIMEARELGISFDEVKEFLNNGGQI